MKWSKNEEHLFSLFWHVRLPETPLRWQNTKKFTPSLYSHSILHGNNGPIWSISVATMYSEHKGTQKKVSLVKASPDRRIQKRAQMRSNQRL